MLNSAKQCKMICRHCCILLNKNATPLRSINSPSFLKFLSSINAHNAVQKNSVFFKSIVAVPLARYSSRNKQKKTSGDQNVDEDNDESGDSDDENEEEIKGKGVEVKTYSLSSLRIDLLLKTSLGYNRRRIEELFFEKKLRVNGKLLLKKGINAKVGDELDVIKGFTPENPNFLTVTRVEVLKVQLNEEEDRFLVKVRKTKSLVVDNYDDKNKFCMV